MKHYRFRANVDGEPWKFYMNQMIEYIGHGPGIYTLEGVCGPIDKRKGIACQAGQEIRAVSDFVDAKFLVVQVNQHESTIKALLQGVPDKWEIPPAERKPLPDLTSLDAWSYDPQAPDRDESDPITKLLTLHFGEAKMGESFDTLGKLDRLKLAAGSAVLELSERIGQRNGFYYRYQVDSHLLELGAPTLEGLLALMRAKGIDLPGEEPLEPHVVDG